ncbi:MAG TPA: DUF402 domain-containing protein [Chloroflexota bacterium]|nr:DUF402 domain-containing protein [Chloroflexota bacterium]
MVEKSILVRKLNYEGCETWRWTGRLVEQVDGVTVIDAIFNAPPRDLGYMTLETTDLFHEFYYADRWFNIFQVFKDDGTLKGWYCNVTKPAVIADGEIDFVDMALDVFVYPDGRTLVLDEDEFEEKRQAIYSAEDARLAREAVRQLLDMAQRRVRPFESAGNMECGTL